jgi:predicted SAM-dependent methyltransferase
MQVVVVDSCPCCASRRLAWPYLKNEETVDAFRLLSHRKYGGYMDGWEQTLSLCVAMCSDCGHIWHHTHPDQDALFGMYAHGRRLKGGVANVVPSMRMVSTMRGLRHYCNSSMEKPTLLDYGSGAGRWSVAAVRAGFRVTAYEPETTRQGQIMDIEVLDSLQALEGRHYDVINLEQVLEHIPDPAASLKILKQFSHPSTVVRVSVPDVSRLGSRLWDGFPFNGESMHILSPYEHLHGFRQSSLLALMKSAGLRRCADIRLMMCLPRYVLEQAAIHVGSPFGRTTVIAKFQNDRHISP